MAEPTKPPTGARRKPQTAPTVDEEALRERAYHIWESEGRPEGRDQAHWEQACREAGLEAPLPKPKSPPKRRSRASGEGAEP